MTVKFDLLEHDPAYRRLSSAIEEQILNGRLVPGTALPTEEELAEQFGVNRSTVREGIRSLEMSGLIGREGSRRLKVMVPDRAMVAAFTRRAMVMRGITFQEHWEMLMELEPVAARLAAQRVTSEQKTALAENVTRTEAVLADDPALIECDVAFHMLVAEATRNRALVLSEEPIAHLLYSATRHLYQRSPKARTRLLEAHRRIFLSIAEGNGAEAEGWMRKHVEDFRRGWKVAGLSMDQAITPAF